MAETESGTESEMKKMAYDDSVRRILPQLMYVAIGGGLALLLQFVFKIVISMIYSTSVNYISTLIEVAIYCLVQFVYQLFLLWMTQPNEKDFFDLAKLSKAQILQKLHKIRMRKLLDFNKKIRWLFPVLAVLYGIYYIYVKIFGGCCSPPSIRIMTAIYLIITILYIIINSGLLMIVTRPKNTKTKTKTKTKTMTKKAHNTENNKEES
jgi:hypothetical protein